MIRKSPRAALQGVARRPPGQSLASAVFDPPKEGWALALTALFEGLGVDPPKEGTLSALAVYLEEVIRWGRKIDLVAPRTPDELLELSFADAIVLYGQERKRGSERSFVDVGSGGGAPGVPLAVLLAEEQDCAFTFVEPRDKRVAFLHHLVGTLGLSRARVVRGRSESIREVYDVALSRATLPPPLWLAEGGRLAEAVWLLLAREEIPAAPELELETIVDYSWPLRAIPHRAVRFLRKP